jgi:chitinase
MDRLSLVSKLAAAAGALVFVATLGASPALAARDRTPPTTPSNFRVVASTSYTVTLAWGASTDNSGSVRYLLSASSGESVTLPGSTTSYTWRSGLLAGYSYTFTIRALDPSGNASPSVSASATLPADRTAPSSSTLSVTEVGTTHVGLSWTAALEDGPFVGYRLLVSGAPVDVGSGTSYVLTGLSPNTSYTITVEAYDNWQNVSPPSNAVSVTTATPDPGDTIPPSQPANLTDNGMVFGDGETWLFWDQSSDDVTLQSLIAYRVFLNGVLDHVVVGRGSTVLYAPTGGSSTIEVVAVDEAGNASPPATLTITVP